MIDMTRVTLVRAKDLVQQKKYAEALKVLEGVDHPTAAKWREELQKRVTPAQLTVAKSSRQAQPAKAPIKSKKRLPWWAWLTIFPLAVLIVILIVGGQGVFRNMQVNSIDGRLISYCHGATYERGSDQARFFDVSRQRTPAYLLADCTRFPKDALAEYPFNIQDCYNRSGSDTEFERCIEPLEIVTGVYDGSFAWLDFSLHCYRWHDSFAAQNACESRAVSAIQANTEAYRDCYYAFGISQAYRPGMNSVDCWQERSLMLWLYG